MLCRTPLCCNCKRAAPVRRQLLWRRLRLGSAVPAHGGDAPVSASASDAELYISAAEVEARLAAIQGQPASPNITSSQGSPGGSMDEMAMDTLRQQAQAHTGLSCDELGSKLEELQALIPGISERHLLQQAPEVLRLLCANTQEAALRLVALRERHPSSTQVLDMVVQWPELLVSLTAPSSASTRPTDSQPLTSKHHSSSNSSSEGGYLLGQQGCPVTCLALSADGSTAVSGGGDGKVRLWDVDQRSCVAILQRERGLGEVSSLTLSPDGHWALATQGRRLHMWDLRGLSCSLASASSSSSASSVALSPDRRLAFTGNVYLSNTPLVVWELDTGRAVPLSRRAGPEQVHAVAVAQAGARVLVAGDNLTWWDTQSRLLVQHWSGQEGVVLCAAVAGDIAVTGSDRGAVQRWRLDDQRGGCMGTMFASGPVRAVGSCSEGGMAVCGCEDGAIELLSWGREAHVARLQVHEGPVRCLSVCEDKGLVVSGGHDGTLRVWSVPAGLQQ